MSSDLPDRPPGSTQDVSAQRQDVATIPRNEWMAHLAVMAFFALAALIPTLHPEIDLKVSQAYFVPGKGFPARHDPLLYLMFEAIDIAGRALGAALLVLLPALLWLRRRSSGARRWTLPVAFLLSALLLGPLITANGVFKEHWGRARPRNVVLFEGTKPFTPALQIASNCERNCSFVSGHASLAYFPLVIAFLRRRNAALWLALGAACGLAVGWARIAVGAHFLSDVLFAFFATYLPALVLALFWTLAAQRAPLSRMPVNEPTNH